MTAPTLLVAPDHPRLETLREVLAMGGRTVVASTEADAVGAVSEPGLIVVALDRDGNRSAVLCARLPCQDVPVVLLLGDPGPADLLRVLGCGAAACLSDQLAPQVLAAHFAALEAWTPETPMRLDLAVDLHAGRRKRVQDLLRWISATDGGLASEAVVERLVEGDRRATLGRLSEAVAHDFNNLLTVIAGRARLVLDRYWGDDATRGQLELILGAAEKATSLSRKLLAVGRPWDMGSRNLDLEVFLAEVRDVLAETAPDGVEVSLAAVPPDTRVVADPARLEQVLLNLGLNAIDALPIKGGRVELSVRLTRSQEGPGMTIQVLDTGPGMDAATLERAFEPFFSTRGRSGLGLATVQQILEGLNGTVDIESRPGEGTRVRVNLPLADEALDDPASAGKGAIGTARVLVVEDEEAVRSLIATVLTRTGFDVIEAGTAEQALECRDKLDLVITDLAMVGMNGTALASRLRTLHPGLRVLYISGHHGTIVSNQGVDLEALEFLQKPFTPDLLLDRVSRLLQGHR